MNDTCEIIIKNKNIKLPEPDFLERFYKQFKYKYITLIYNNGNYVYVDKECENLDLVLEDFYKDIKTEDMLVMLFHNQQKGYYTDCSDNLFYKTKRKIIISQKNISCIDLLLTFDKNKFSPLFDMFLKNNRYIEIDYHSMYLYGSFVCSNQLYCSTELTPQKHCIFCANTKSTMYTINDNSYICSDCIGFTHLCKQCKCCNKYFTESHMANDSVCLTCKKQIDLDIKKIALENYHNQMLLTKDKKLKELIEQCALQ